MTDANSLGILVFEGFEELDAIGPYEVFSKAASHGADWTVDLLATEPTDRVTAAMDLRIEPDGVLESDGTLQSGRNLDFLLVPGGGWNDRADAGARALAKDEGVLRALRRLHDEGTTLLSVCTGAMVLAEAELLDGRPAVTHRGAIEELRVTGAEVVDARVVDDGDVLTAGGVTAGVDLALWLVEREWGENVADSVADAMEYDRSDDIYRAGE